MRVTHAKDSELANVIHAYPEGMLEARGADLLWDAISESLRKETPYLLMDMSKIRFMTSAGVGVLIRLLTRVRNLNGAMSLYGGSDRNRAILKVVGIKPLVNVCDTVEQSRDSLRKLGAV